MENIIKNKIELFNEEEPFEGHFERFANKLSNYRKKRIGLRKRVIYIVSAAAMILMLFGLMGRTFYLQNTQYKPVNLIGNISEEHAETEKYYNNIINEKFELIKSNDQLGSRFQKYLILKDFNQSEKEFELIKRDLNENPYNERIINAIIMHYETKVELLDEIISKTNSLEI